MSGKTLVVLALLVAGLGGFFYYDTYWLEPAREKKDSVKGRLWEVEPKDVESLTVKRKGETVRIRRTDTGWELLEPVKTRADRGAVDGIVTTLVTARVDREVAATPGKLDEFGLAPPEIEVTLEVKGRAPLALLVGAKSPTGAWLFAKESGKPAVVALSEVVARDLAKPVTELRDRTVLAFDRKGVGQVDLQLPGEALTLESAEAGKWRLTKPRVLPADPDVVADFLEKLDGAKAKEFVEDAPRSLAPYGLDHPTTVTLWIGKDKERASRSLLFGREDKGKKGVYVMRSGEPGVMLVGEELWAAVPKTMGVLRDKVVLAYQYDKVSRVELAGPRGPLTLERDGIGWKITAPEVLKADTGAVNGVLWRIRDLRASGFLAEDAAAIPRLLPKPEVTVRLWEEGAKEPQVLLLAASRETRGGQPAALAAVEGRGPVVLVDGKVLGDLARGADDLRDKTLLPAFEMSDVKRARVVSGGAPLVVERKGESDWQVVEPKRGGTKERRVADLLLSLKSLRWKSIVSPKGDDAARFGLDKPELEVTLLKADGGEIAGLLVGKSEGPQTYVKLKTSPTVYTVDSRLIRDLQKAPGEIPG
ncbi:MAG TPA: DUF4340 domain-containing protein [Pseudomonadales bacterium]|nr:DUF4340 domain-containing protein [Pseudomonadales bacterium]